ncbi:MAG TPA: GNAT family N-acetyltransferase [Bacteroidales bacterium]|jgi:diamine N-acetyltransferase|nr:GNAT family N-acetyltransferase [Bacteroidales bacterium]
MEGTEIILRAPEPSDLEILYRWENDRETWQVSNTITPFSKYILEKYIENAHLDIYQVKQLRLMIDVKEKLSVKTVGTIDLFDFDPYHLRAGVGILIGDKSDRGQGYASQALGKFIQYCFNILQLHQLFCNITPTNVESLRLFKKWGFRITGRKADWIKTVDGFAEELLLQLINTKTK